MVFFLILEDVECHIHIHGLDSDPVSLVRHLLLNIRCTPEKRIGQQDVVVCECLLPPSAVGLAGSGAALGVTDGLETTLVKPPPEVIPVDKKEGFI